MRHIDAVEDFRFRGQWYEVNPSQWPDRTKCTVRVGTGTGNHQLQLAALGQVLTMQTQLAQTGSILVNNKTGFNALDDYCKFSGLNGATRYFVDPDSPEGKKALEDQQAQQAEEKEKQDQIEQIMVDAQAKVAEAEMISSKSEAENVQLKAQLDNTKNQLTGMKNQSSAEIAFLNQKLAETKELLANINKDRDRELKLYDTNSRLALELTRIEKDSQKNENANYKGNKETVSES